MMKHTFFFGKLTALIAVGWLVLGLTGCDLGSYDGSISYTRVPLPENYRAKMAYDGSETLRFEVLDVSGEPIDTLTFTSPKGLEERERVYLLTGALEGSIYESIYIRFVESSDTLLDMELELSDYGRTDEQFYFRYGDDFVVFASVIGIQNPGTTERSENNHSLMYSTSLGILSLSTNSNLFLQLIN